MQTDLDLLHPFYKRYAEHVKEVEIDEALRYSIEKMLQTVNGIPEARGNHKYQPDKWSIKELLCHVIDTERIFSYRALCFARNDKTSLPGFEENDYATVCLANEKTLESLLNDYHCVRKATISLYKSFSHNMLLEIGTASAAEMSVRAIGFVIIGHENHHCEVIKERYLK